MYLSLDGEILLKQERLNMDGATFGWIGGILGGILGCMGGVIGTYFSIKNTNGPRERSFMIKCAAVGWIAIAIFLILLTWLPNPYRHILWAPYGVALAVGIRYCNRRQNIIREEEKQA
jgi:hypothetical protein